MTTKKLQALIFLLLFGAACTAQKIVHFKESRKFSRALEQIIKDAGLDKNFDAGEDGKETISFAVIDLTGRKPVFGGVNAANLIYPASVYKMYVAMEVLQQVSSGSYSLYTPYIVKSPNDVDRRKEIFYDPRPLLKAGDTVTINYLLDLMITRSDNSAANCLIDIAKRTNINRTMQENGWQGSEVTRKFLSRKLEDPGFDTVRGTETSALHAADFMYRIARNELVSPWVSRQMKVLLGRQLDTSKLSQGLPPTAVFYHKTGWWSIYTNDVGIVEDGKLKYVIALFTPVREEEVRPRLRQVAEKVHQLIRSRN
jgi:beta-lactamase class A